MQDDEPTHPCAGECRTYNPGRDRVCGASRNDYACTREPGHAGPHEACGTSNGHHPILRWHDENDMTLEAVGGDLYDELGNVFTFDGVEDPDHEYDAAQRVRRVEACVNAFRGTPTDDIE